MTDADLGQRILQTFAELRRAKAEYAAHSAALHQMAKELTAVGPVASDLAWDPEHERLTAPVGSATWPDMEAVEREAKGRYEAEQRISQLQGVLKDMGADPDLLRPEAG